MSSIRVIQGDCLEVMRGLEAESVDSVVCDPPYGLEFMGREWDKLWDKRTVERNIHDGYVGSDGARRSKSSAFSQNHVTVSKMMGGAQAQAFHEAWAREALRVAKPGAMLLAFGGTRTHHRLMCAIEDAGWEIRDVLCWLYGSGFPKGHDTSRDFQIQRHGWRGKCLSNDAMLRPLEFRLDRWEHEREWRGWNCALKPAYEPIVLAMKPLDGTFAGNAEKHGVAGLWIEGCRVGIAEGDGQNFRVGRGQSNGKTFASESLKSVSERHTSGRWPPNLVLSHHPECVRRGVKRVRANQSSAPGSGKGHEETEGHGIYRGVGGRVSKSTAAPDGTETVEDWACHADCPVAALEEPARFFPNFSADGDKTARFLYCPKASRKERNAGCEGMEEKRGGCMCANAGDEMGLGGASLDGNPKPKRAESNHHPTVKPIALMEWLLRLTKTPTGGVGLDMFGGSGTTGVAAVNTGRDWILIEKDAEYCEIARKRIEHARKQRGAKQGALSI